jgi:sulfate transport system permease protein
VSSSVDVLPGLSPVSRRTRTRRARALPGVRPAIAASVVFITLLVVVPVGALVSVVARAPLARILEVLSAPRTLAAYGLSLGAALLAALISVPLGLAIAWTLSRYELPGRRVLDAIVDLPFAMPTAVSGIALTALYAPDGTLGAPLAALGFAIAFHRAGVVVALVLVSLPFVVRTVQPVIESFPREVEEAARSLGASRAATFWRVHLPALRPALASGAILAFARSLGEYGSVVFIAGNVPMRTEIAPLLVLVHLEEYDYVGAAIVATGLIAASIGLLLLFQTGERRLTAHRRPT